MALKKSKNIFKKILTNHITEKGKKHTIEKILTKSFKQTQKQQKKNATNIIKTSILGMIPTFRIVKLTNKRRRKKSVKQIPIFLSNNKSRSSWGLKKLTNFSTQEASKTNLLKKLTNQLLLTTTESENKNIELKNKQQNEALKEKKYFKYYRW